MSAPRRVVVRRLVLDGVAGRDRERVATAFQAELTRLLAGTPAGRPPTAGSAEDLGRQAAVAVHARIVEAAP